MEKLADLPTESLPVGDTPTHPIDTGLLLAIRSKTDAVCLISFDQIGILNRAAERI